MKRPSSIRRGMSPRIWPFSLALAMNRTTISTTKLKKMTEGDHHVKILLFLNFSNFILKIISLNFYYISNLFGCVKLYAVAKTWYCATCISVARSATVYNDFQLENLVVPLPFARQQDRHANWIGATRHTFGKIISFLYDLGWRRFYMKIIDLDEIYNSLVLSFFIWSR
jgi:hypothetical protein